MARSHYRGTIYGDQAAGVKPLSGAAVRLYDPLTGNPWPYPVYPDPVNGAAYTSPILTDAVGTLDLWADEPARVAVTITHPSYRGSGGVIDIEPDPAESATDEDVSESVAEHEAKENPHDQYLTQDEADLAYLKLTGGTLTGPLTVQGALTAATYIDSRKVYFSPVGADTALFDIAESGNALVFSHTGVVAGLTIAATTGAATFAGSVSASAVYDAGNRVETLNHKGAASGYVPLGADTKIPNAYLPDLAITNTFVVTSEAEMLALNAQTGDVCVRLDTTENYILAAEPATVLANWTKLAASTTAGNTTIVKREEFAPAAAATSVSLAAVPTQMLSVSRNGVEQSQPAGHYTVAGVTVTFTDAFVAGERVSVVYEVGSSAPAPINGYTKLESDARYEPIDTMYTKAESDARYLQPSVAASTYLPLAGGTISGDLVRNGADLTNRLIRWQTGGADRFRFGIRDTQAEDGDDNGSDLVLDTYWTYDSTWKPILRVDRYYPNLYVYAMLYLDGAGGTTYLRLRRTGESEPRFEIGDQGQVRWGAGGFSPIDTVLSRTGANAMGLDGSLSPTSTNTRDLGALSMRWRSAYLGTVLSIAGASATANQITHAITTDAQPRLIVDGNGYHKWGPGAAVAQDTFLQRVGVGALRVDTHLGVGVTPIGWGANHRAIQVGGLGALWGDAIATTPNSSFFSNNAYYDGTTWRAMALGSSCYVQLQDGLAICTAPSVAAGAAITQTTRFAINQYGTVSLTPAQGQDALESRGMTRIGGQTAWGGYAVLQVNNAPGMDVLLTGYSRFGIECNPSASVAAGNTGIDFFGYKGTASGTNAGTMTNLYAMALFGPDTSNTGTISNCAALYVTNPSAGGTITQNRAIIHGNTGASLTTAGAWTNAPSWLEGKSAVRYVEGKDVALFADWFTMGWKPARYRYPALTDAEAKLGTEGKPVLRPVTNESEYDHFFTILDEVPQEVREVICVDDTGAISTKDMDGFLAALLQHALQRIVALEAKVNG